jgi:hypothetical protein
LLDFLDPFLEAFLDPFLRFPPSSSAPPCIDLEARLLDFLDPFLEAFLDPFLRFPPSSSAPPCIDLEARLLDFLDPFLRFPPSSETLFTEVSKELPTILSFLNSRSDIIYIIYII